MDDCIFCKIVRGEIPCFKVWEDEKHLAILDIFPNTKGMTVVLTKEHHDSYAFEMPIEEYLELMEAARVVGRLLDKKLGVNRTAMVAEGMGINHVHIKLYPMHDIEDRAFGEHKERKYFEKYPGYTTTLLGPDADKKELEALAEHIRS